MSKRIHICKWISYAIRLLFNCFQNWYFLKPIFEHKCQFCQVGCCKSPLWEFTFKSANKKKYIDKSQYNEHNLICIVKFKCNLKFLVKMNFNFLYNLDYLWTFTWNSNVSLLYDNFPAIMQIKKYTLIVFVTEGHNSATRRTPH